MVQLTVEIHKETPVYVQIMDQIKARVRDGALAPGSPLPSVRQLAAELEVNPNTVAKAYTLLEREAIIRTLSRRRTIVADSAVAGASRAVERRLDRLVERLIDETSQLGLEKAELLDALERRLDAGDPEEPR